MEAHTQATYVSIFGLVVLFDAGEVGRYPVQGDQDGCCTRKLVHQREKAVACVDSGQSHQRQERGGCPVGHPNYGVRVVELSGGGTREESICNYREKIHCSLDLKKSSSNNQPSVPVRACQV